MADVMDNPYGFNKIYDINLTEVNIFKICLFFNILFYISGVRGEHLALLIYNAEHDSRTRRDDHGEGRRGAPEETLEVDTAKVTHGRPSHDLVNNSFCV